MSDTKLCPYCAEAIKAAAIVCKHCGRELPGFEELAPRVQVVSKPPDIKIEDIDYKDRNYNLFGYRYSSGAKQYKDFFPRFEVSPPQLNDELRKTEIVDPLPDKYYIGVNSGIPDYASTKWDLPENNSPGNWRQVENKSLPSSLIFLANLWSIVTDKKIDTLFEAEYRGPVEYVFRNEMPDLVLGVSVDEARLIRRVSNFNIATIFEYAISCAERSLNSGDEPNSNGDIFAELITLAKAYGAQAREFVLQKPADDTESISLQFANFLDDNSPKLEENATDTLNKLRESEPNINIQMEQFSGRASVLAIFEAKFSDALFNFPELFSQPAHYSRIKGARSYLEYLKGQGFNVSLYTKDPQEKLVADRAWFAGIQKETAWQVSLLEDLLQR
ncbi:MAG: hypothetical protein DWQ07_17245 [Chloroflexi bacterium]|nr:MAG: hypothetical protein DWQ07_17245 [Chloroflexota bacterium]MBL1195152.1 hypothetical protein [Chloroflexota bacterium]NOH12437.1 hypothetical protein [Chloroflexota bacterium]